MRRLARPEAGDAALAVGASGAAGVAALLALRAGPGAVRGGRRALGLGPTGRVFVIATEGVTEPDLWQEVTGLEPPVSAVPGP